jgi:hypothetical protein
MLHDALYYLMLFTVGGIGILIFGTIITVVVTIGSEVTAGVFLLMWRHGWFKAVTVVTAVLLIGLLLAATS